MRQIDHCIADGAPASPRKASVIDPNNGGAARVAIFTRNGHAAREFAARVNVGMVGINVPIPVPAAYHSFDGWKRSAFGDTNQHGMEDVTFWTKLKPITGRWPDGSPDGGNSFVMPTMG